MYNETILLGVVLSLIFTEITGLSAGLIVPGYLALYLTARGALYAPCCWRRRPLGCANCSARC